MIFTEHLWNPGFVFMEQNLNNLQNFISNTNLNRPTLNFLNISDVQDKEKTLLLTLYRRRYDVTTQTSFYKRLQDVVNPKSSSRSICDVLFGRKTLWPVYDIQKTF